MYIVTGGAGFIGSVLVRELNRIGIDDILIVDNLRDSEKWRNLVSCRYVAYQHRDEFFEHVRQGGAGLRPQALFHLGACSSTTERDADFLMRNNVDFSKRVCLWALNAGARVVNASSAATYGDGSSGFSDDPSRIPALRPLNMYGYSKQLVDLWLLREGLDNSVASLKFFNVYGPNEYHKGDMRSVVAKAFEQISATGRMRLFRSCEEGMADGEQKRDFVYVKDCAALMIWLLQHPDVNGVRNVGTGCARSFNDLAAAVFAAMGREREIDYVDMPAHLAGKYQSFTEADMGWLARTSCTVTFSRLEDGVRDYVQNYLMKGCAFM